MRVPTDDEQRQAAERLAQLARTPGLEGGLATFYGDGLDRVRWSLLWEPFEEMDRLEVRVPAASAYFSDDELMRACQWELSESLINRSDQARTVLYGVCVEGIEDHWRRRARGELAWLDDNVARSQFEERLGKLEECR
jgi:hypothetical protein